MGSEMCIRDRSKEGDQSSGGWGWGSDWGVGNLDITSTLNSIDLNSVMESAQSIDISSTVNSLSEQASTMAEQASTMVREMEQTVEREYKAMETNEVGMAAAGAAAVGATAAVAAASSSSAPPLPPAPSSARAAARASRRSSSPSCTATPISRSSPAASNLWSRRQSIRPRSAS